MPKRCTHCGKKNVEYPGLFVDGYCYACDHRYGCTCCAGDAAQCGCTFKQTGKLYYDCTVHGRVVRVVAKVAPVKQVDYFRL